MTDADDADEEAGDESEWRFDVADVGDIDELSVEPEPVDPINAAFFVLGIAATIALVLSVFI